MNKVKLLLFLYPLVILALFFYSFTQVDLSLTLSQASFVQTLEKTFQTIGFFQRPFSTAIFAVIMVLLFSFYLLFLYLAKKGKLEIKQVKPLVFISFIFLVFSYNAFSYDLFNYIFDAKIVTFYHQNPYLHQPNDFTNDPMLNFMRWTHRLYPYGPTWLFLTVPLTFIGMNYFLPTFFLFKLLMGLSFLGSCYLIYKISEKLFPQYKILNLVFWAFNPLVLVESLVSAHNDLPMIFLLLLGIYLYIKRKTLPSIISYILSIGIKFSTGVLAPVFLYVFIAEKMKKKIDWEKIFMIAASLAFFTVVIAAMRTTFQPWYLLLTIALASFISKKSYVFIPTLVVSITTISVYGVYVYMTDYAKGYPEIIASVETWGLIFLIIVPLIYLFFRKFNIIKAI